MCPCSTQCFFSSVGDDTTFDTALFDKTDNVKCQPITKMGLAFVLKTAAEHDGLTAKLWPRWFRWNTSWFL